MEMRPGSSSLCNFFRGRWQLSRKVLHSTTSELMGVLEGTAEFVSVKDPPLDHSHFKKNSATEWLLYTEKGLFQQPPAWATAEVYRSYYYTFPPSTAEPKSTERVEVYLTGLATQSVEEGGPTLPEVGTFFHDLEIPVDTRQSSTEGLVVEGCKHPCGEDVYLPSFIFHFERELFLVDMKVVGPAKEYSILSRFEKIK